MGVARPEPAVARRPVPGARSCRFAGAPAPTVEPAPARPRLRPCRRRAAGERLGQGAEGTARPWARDRCVPVVARPSAVRKESREPRRPAWPCPPLEPAGCRQAGQVFAPRPWFCPLGWTACFRHLVRTMGCLEQWPQPAPRPANSRATGQGRSRSRQKCRCRRDGRLHRRRAGESTRGWFPGRADAARRRCCRRSWWERSRRGVRSVRPRLLQGAAPGGSRCPAKPPMRRASHAWRQAPHAAPVDATTRRSRRERSRCRPASVRVRPARAAPVPSRCRAGCRNRPSP